VDSETSKILFSCLNKQSDSDPVPTWLLKCASALVPIISNVVNLSLSSRQFSNNQQYLRLSTNLRLTKISYQITVLSLTFLSCLKLMQKP